MRKKRVLPSHVDGRIMVGPFPIKGFLLFLPLGIGIAAISFMNIDQGPAILFFAAPALGLSALPFVELRNRETGLDYIKTVIKHELGGQKILERGTSHVPIHEKFIHNKKVQEIRRRKRNQAADKVS